MGGCGWDRFGRGRVRTTAPRIGDWDWSWALARRVLAPVGCLRVGRREGWEEWERMGGMGAGRGRLCTTVPRIGDWGWSWALARRGGARDWRDCAMGAWLGTGGVARLCCGLGGGGGG